ncbi:MAG: SDR family oxidoreductase [Clostridia bacterium]|nr:SDR family oxidoreductase [Clostridia bacterium]
MKVLEGKRAVITGGSDGIGYAIAKAFAENGADLLLIARNQEKLENAARDLSAYESKVEVLSHDLSNTESIDSLIEKVSNVFPDINILVNNAGGAEFIPFERVSPQQYDKLFDLNVKAAFLLTQGLLPSLKENKGSIINISSFHAQRVMPGYPSTVYSMAKAAVNAFTKALAYEIGPLGVRVNAIAPGNVSTTKVKAAMANVPEQAKLKMQEMIKGIYPLGRIGNAEEIGGVAVYLASEQASWVTGSIFNIDGGLTTN